MLLSGGVGGRSVVEKLGVERSLLSNVCRSFGDGRGGEDARDISGRTVEVTAGHLPPGIRERRELIWSRYFWA